ncbi:hypothetical protein O3P69_002261 [Scylla paramamosain]|uniref:Uncharacterized protein n=1 Tax=Scylla paramamosain TaxID=85552 RepID=A0AAW0V6I0_SCYPA
MLSSPEERLEQCRRETMVACRQVLMDKASVVSYGKTVEGGPESQQEQIDNAKFFQRAFDNILSLSHELRIPPVLAPSHRMRRNKQAHRRGKVVFDYKHEMNHVPVLSKKSSNMAMDYPSVSKLPALNTDALRSVFKSIENFISRFSGVSADKYGRYFNFAHEVMFCPGPVLLELSVAYADFKKLARSIFINTKTKTVLVFLGGVEPYRQVDMFSAAASAFPGLAKRVGMAECIAFYPDLMCTEYDFIGLGLKKLLQDSRCGVMDIKINCIKGLDRDGNDNKENVFRYRKNLINRMPFVVVEICNLAQRLINNGLAITKATANYFAVDIKDNTRPQSGLPSDHAPVSVTITSPRVNLDQILEGALALGDHSALHTQVAKRTRSKKPVRFTDINIEGGARGIETIRETVDLDVFEGFLSAHLSGCALKQYAFKETTKRPYDIP